MLYRTWCLRLVVLEHIRVAQVYKHRRVPLWSWRFFVPDGERLIEQSDYVGRLVLLGSKVLIENVQCDGVVDDDGWELTVRLATVGVRFIVAAEGFEQFFSFAGLFIFRMLSLLPATTRMRYSKPM